MDLQNKIYCIQMFGPAMAARAGFKMVILDVGALTD